jgi:hydrophobic/amphiphilic exporter-1 (mainly G- bacteria), HAE1 family
VKALYSRPKRLYFLVIAFTVLGIVLSRFLPVTLFPNSAKPEFRVNVGLRGMTPDDFYHQFGDELQANLRKIEGAEKVNVRGEPGHMNYRVEFKWGIDAKKAEREVQTAVETIRPRLPKEMRETINYHQAQSNSAFYAASITAADGDLTALKKTLEPLIYAPIKALEGTKSVGLTDPNWQNVYITVNPERAIFYRVDVFRLANYIENALAPIYPGSVQLGEHQYQILLQNKVENIAQLEDLSLEPFGTPGLKLKDVALIELRQSSEGSNIYKTDGKQSLILFVNPRDDANLKELCDKVTEILATTKSKWPPGSDYKILVNPSNVINAAVKDVYESIALGGFFAVVILLLFVGSLKLTIFSALEIPLAMAWAFILMYFNNVGINLVSLGGLALSAGMNVDASVVMVENIIRHFEMDKNKTRERLDVIIDAVNEVKWPIVTSTLASVIVFLPLSMTSGVTYAILGDLAKAVVYSHVFSAIVAIILVPTIRSQIDFDPSDMNRVSRLFNTFYDRFVLFYQRFLGFILSSKIRRASIAIGAFTLVLGVSYALLPKIKKEIIAVPSSELIYMWVSISGTTTTEDAAIAVEPYEKIIKNEFADTVDYTFTQIYGRDEAAILAHLKSKKTMKETMKRLETKLTSTPQIQFRMFPFNPSKLPIPNPPHLSVRITGPDDDVLEYAEKLKMELEGTRLFAWVDSTVKRVPQFTLTPHFHTLDRIREKDPTAGPSLSDLGEIIASGIRSRGLGFIKTGDKDKYVYVQYPEQWFKTSEDIAAIPIVANANILPLSALASLKLDDAVSGFYIEEETRNTMVYGYLTQNAREDKYNNEQKLKAMVEKMPRPKDVQVIIEDSQVEINKSLKGLILAFLISLCLIAMIVYIQFENIKDVLIIKAAIPLGFLGVSLALWVFDSTWSINSFLGVILLGGIAVNNSIIIVSFYNQCRNEGLDPITAAIKSASVRMRPVLITSFTTILAMIPLAMGLGQGGEVLQPLGISVSFGMLFSTILTLIVIPCLEVIADRKHV